MRNLESRKWNRRLACDEARYRSNLVRFAISLLLGGFATLSSVRVLADEAGAWEAFSRGHALMFQKFNWCVLLTDASFSAQKKETAATQASIVRAMNECVEDGKRTTDRTFDAVKTALDSEPVELTQWHSAWLAAFASILPREGESEEQYDTLRSQLREALKQPDRKLIRALNPDLYKQ